MKRTLVIAGIVAIVTGLLGCSSSLVSKKWPRAEFATHPTVAIFPFDNLSNQEQVGTKIAEYFQTFLAAHGNLQLVDPGAVYDCLRKHRIRSSALITASQLDSIVAELKISYFVTGAVLEYREMDNTYLGKVPQVSFNTRVIDCVSKNTVWAGASNGSGDQAEVVFGLGAIRSADDLARHMAQKATDKISGLFNK